MKQESSILSAGEQQGHIQHIVFCWLRWQVDEILSLVRQETSEVTNLMPEASLEGEPSTFLSTPFCSAWFPWSKIVKLKSAHQEARILGVILPKCGWPNWIYAIDFFSLGTLDVLGHHSLETRILEVNAVGVTQKGDSLNLVVTQT